MSKKKVSVDELSNVVLEYLENFKDVTEEACRDGVLTTADEAVKELRSAHPAGSGKYGSWDKYDKGWAKRAETMKTKEKGILAIVYNAKHYRLTHLLEKGHALVGGGRTQAFPHIAPVEQQCEEKLIKNIKKNI
ncbi:MAG: HK97 gp10 family phage protein [Clostridiales bacterium]|nr:HK97 gp10 family phage protein [Clostridiales bacterium]MBQ1571551.1 HK97 gp10 family phage protein [Clostridiales bacterium]